MRKFLVVIWILGLSAIMSACASSPQALTTPDSSLKSKAPVGATLPAGFTGIPVKVGSNSYYDVSVDDLKNLLTSKDFLLVNVHTPFEGNLPATDISIPYDQIDQNIMKLPADKKTKIVLYCRSGRMSTIAAEELVNLGYSHIMNLKGGMIAWENAGLPVEK